MKDENTMTKDLERAQASATEYARRLRLDAGDLFEVQREEYNEATNTTALMVAPSLDGQLLLNVFVRQHGRPPRLDELALLNAVFQPASQALQALLGGMKHVIEGWPGAVTLTNLIPLIEPMAVVGLAAYLHETNAQRLDMVPADPANRMMYLASMATFAEVAKLWAAEIGKVARGEAKADGPLVRDHVTGNGTSMFVTKPDEVKSEQDMRDMMAAAHALASMRSGKGVG